MLISISEISIFSLTSSSSCILSLSSFAAFSENVRHRISDGFSPVLSRNLIRSVITRVFPLPGPAVTNSGEPTCSIAASFPRLFLYGKPY